MIEAFPQHFSVLRHFALRFWNQTYWLELINSMKLSQWTLSTNAQYYIGKVYLLLTQGGKGSSEVKKVQQILTSKYVMGILNWFKIVKNKKIHEAILEIAVNTHSPFWPKLVDYSACVPPALQNGFVNSFDFDNFELHKHSYTQFWSQTLLDFFSLWVTLATLGAMLFEIDFSIKLY